MGDRPRARVISSSKRALPIIASLLVEMLPAATNILRGQPVARMAMMLRAATKESPAPRWPISAHILFRGAFISGISRLSLRPAPATARPRWPFADEDSRIYRAAVPARRAARHYCRFSISSGTRCLAARRAFRYRQRQLDASSCNGSPCRLQMIVKRWSATLRRFGVITDTACAKGTRGSADLLYIAGISAWRSKIFDVARFGRRRDTLDAA